MQRKKSYLVNRERGNNLPMATTGGLARWGRSFLKLLRTAWGEYERDYARFLAGAMVYYALVSLIPLLLLLLSALGLLLRFSDFAGEAQQQVLRNVEARFGNELVLIIEPLLNNLQQQSVIATMISLITLLVTASVLFRQLRLSFRALWKQPPPRVSGSLWVVIRTSLREQIVAYVMVLAGCLLLIVALTLISVGWWLNGLVSELPLLNRVSTWVLTTATPFALAIFTFALLFRFLPPVAIRWRDVWLASVFSAAIYWIAGELLTLYGVFFSSNRSAYGIIGGLLVVMVWMNIVGQVLFFGAELCRAVWQLTHKT